MANFKYLIFNHPQNANLKTVLKYQYPNIQLSQGYFNWDEASPSNSNDVTPPYVKYGETRTHQFTWGGNVPVLANFSSTQSWCTVGNLQINGTNSGTGSLDITCSDNSLNQFSNQRTVDVEFVGDISGANQISGAEKLDIMQYGNQYNTM